MEFKTVYVVSGFISFQYNITIHFSSKHPATTQLNADFTQQFIFTLLDQGFVYTALYKPQHRELNGIISTYIHGSYRSRSRMQVRANHLVLLTAWLLFRVYKHAVNDIRSSICQHKAHGNIRLSSSVCDVFTTQCSALMRVFTRHTFTQYIYTRV